MGAFQIHPEKPIEIKGEVNKVSQEFIPVRNAVRPL